MDTRPIENDADHAAAIAEMRRLWVAVEDSPEHDKLAALVDAYETRRWLDAG